MGKLLKLASALAGLGLLGTSLWPIGLVLLAYPAAVLLRAVRRPSGPRPSVYLGGRYILASSFFLLALAAYSAGGLFSPALLSIAGGVVLFSSRLRRALSSKVSSVEGSVLLRSERVPFVWHMVSEVKQGPEDLPRSLASFTGDLLVRTDSRSAYVLLSCLALSPKAAEQKMVRSLKETAAASSAFFLPLDSGASAKFLEKSLVPLEAKAIDLQSKVDQRSALLLRATRGRVSSYARFDLGEDSSPSFPPPTAHADARRPFLWEVLESVEQGIPWRPPDQVSGLIETLRSTKGEKLGERLAELEGSGPNVSLKSLGGDIVELPRSEFRALVEVYS